MRRIKSSCVWLLAVVVIALGNGCTKEEFPKDVISIDQAIETIDDITAWRNGFLTRMRALNGNLYHYGAEVQSDMLVPHYSFGNRGGGFYTFSFTSSDDKSTGLYSGSYIAIKNANFFLEKVARFTPKDDNEKAAVAIAKGYAHFVRAFCYDRLLRYFCRTEDPSQPGVALITKFDPNLRLPGRASQAEVYKLVFDDLDQAYALLHSIKLDGKASTPFITADAVVALRARAYLTKLDYTHAREAAEAVISCGRYALERDGKKLKAMWHNDAPSSELIMMSSARRPDEVPGGASDLMTYDAKRKLYGADWFPTQEVIALYESGDTRKDIYLASLPVSARNTKGKVLNATLVYKYPGAPDLRDNPDVPKAINRPKPFRIAEQYLIAAEACFKLNDETKAKEYLNALRESRGLAATTESGDALWKAIKTERARELAFEGFRLHDLRRWGDPVVRGTAQAVGDNIFDEQISPAGTKYETSDPRFVWPLPVADVIEGNLQQNPGY